MKYLLLILCVSYLSACNEAEHLPGNDLSEKKMRGQVKSVLEKEYALADAFGREIPERLEYSVLFRFNKKGELLEESNIDHRFDAPQVETYLYQYDEAGVAQGKEFYADDTLVARIVIKNNDVGLPSEETYYFSDNGEFSNFYFYNSDNQLVKSNLGNMWGSSEDQFFTYDEKGNKTSEVFLGPNGDTLIANTYVYDPRGRVIKEINDRFNAYMVKTFSYDGNNYDNPVEMQTEVRNMTEWTEVFEYKFDQQGNWVEKINYTIDEQNMKHAVKKWTRELEYW